MGYHARMASERAQEPPAAPARSPHERRKRRLIAVAVSTAVCLEVLEALGRIGAPALPPPPRGRVVDEQLGWGLPAGVRFMWPGRGVTTHSLGLRGPDVRE